MRKNIVYYVTRQYMKQNRRRTITTFAGIVFMVLLMTCVFVGKDTGIRYLEKVAAGKDGEGHVSLYEVNGSDYERIQELSYLSESAGSVSLGNTRFPESANPQRPYLNVKGYTKDCYDWMHISLTQGRFPENQGELVLSQNVIDDGADIQIGDRVDAAFFTRSVTGIGEETKKTFFPFHGLTVAVGETVEVPEQFPYYGENDSFRENRTETGETGSYEVVGFAEVPYELQSAAGYTALTTMTMEQVLKRDKFNLTLIFDMEKLPAGYVDQLQQEFPEVEMKFNNTLLAFSGNSSDTTINLVVRYMTVFFVALIMIASMVLIYNVFNMSYRERSQYLGMLCSVGATGRQKRSSIFYEAFCLLLYGMPVGILLGCVFVWAAITGLRPLITELMSIGFHAGEAAVELQVRPQNLLAVVVCSGITVLISAWLPARKIGKIGPMESIRGNTERKSRRHRFSESAARFLGAEGLLAKTTLTRHSRRTRSISMAAAVFMILLVVTAFGSSTIHQVMEKKLNDDNFGVKLENYDYQLYANEDGEAYQALKQEIQNDPAVEQVHEWRDGMFTAQVDASFYSEDYWEANYDIFNAYHHGTLTKETFEEQWKQETVSANLLSVDADTFRELVKQAGIDPDGLKKNSVLVLNEGEFSTDQVSIWGMEPDRYRYYRVSPMTDLQTGDEFSLKVYSWEKQDYVEETLQIAGLVSAEQMSTYMQGHGDQIVWLIMGPETGEHIADLTRAEEGRPQFSPMLLISMKPGEKQLSERLREQMEQLEQQEEPPFFFIETGYTRNLQQVLVLLADLLLAGFVLLTSVICLLNLFNSIRGWIQGSRQELAILCSVGMTAAQMKKMLLLQCAGIFIRSLAVAAIVCWGLVTAVRRGVIFIFGNLTLELPVFWVIGSIVLAAAVLVFLSIRSLKKELKTELFSSIRGGNLL